MAAQALVLLGGLGLAAGLYFARPRLLHGQGPFDAFPAGVDGSRRIGEDHVTASSKRAYKVSSFRHSDGRLYFVAEKKGDVDWIAYFYTPQTGQRQFWAANADKLEEIDEMRADFDVRAQVLS